MSQNIPSSPSGLAQVTAEDRIFIGLNGYVVALQVSTGIEIWRTKVGMASIMSLVVRGHLLIVGCNGHVYALDVRNGGQHWTTDLKGCGYGFVALSSMDDGIGSGGPATVEEQQRRRRNSS